jgi:Ca2+ transporting ATPase
MVTGDNLITAKAIARECNILNDELLNKPDSVMEGPAFYERMGGIICHTCNQMSPCNCDRNSVKEGVKNLEAFKALHKNLVVLARSRPEDKYLLVTGLKELGDVVAVTGDGTNDAPALKKADVGFAMGITGTEIAKHAADIIIMDDNFASIVKACNWGRNVYDNIRKFLQFQITVSLVALFTAFIGSVVLQDSPLQAIQLLWVNLIIDSLAALALATEPPTLAQLERPPQGRDEYIISRKMLKQIVPMALYMIGILWAICFGGDKFFPEPDLDFRLYNTTMVNSLFAGVQPAGNEFVYSGRLADRDSEKNTVNSQLYIDADKQHGASRHLSNVFNVFVVMCIFNLLNARIINDSFNIFKGVFNNWTFCLIYVFICGGQGVIMEVGSDALKISRGGIHGYHWLIAAILGFTTWIASALFKLIPESACPQLGKKNEEEQEDGHAKKNSGAHVKKISSIVRRNPSRQGSIRPAEEKNYHLEKPGSQRR